MFWEDYYVKHPTEVHKTADGKEVKFVTGDPLIDKWEREIAQGLTPDLTEGLSPEARAKEMEINRRIENRIEIKKRADEDIGLGFSESYGAD